jgi:hypothetical protein
VASDQRHSFFVEFFGGDHADSMFARKIEIVFGVNLAPQADLQHAAVVEQTFLERAAERRAVRILAAEVFVPEIVVGVKLNQVDRAAMIFGDGAQDRKADRVVAANAHRASAGYEDRRDAAFDTAEGIFDRERIDRQVAEIRDAIFLEGIELKDWIPGTNYRRLNANIARAETRAGTICRAAVEGDADDGDVEFIRIGNVGQAAERRDAGEAGVLERVGRLRVRKLELANALELRHEAEMLGARVGQVNCAARKTKDNAETQSSQRFAEEETAEMWMDGSGVHVAFTWA